MDAMSDSPPLVASSRSPQSWTKNPLSPSLRELLCSELPPLRRKVEEPVLLRVTSTWPKQEIRELNKAEPSQLPSLLLRPLQRSLEERMDMVDSFQIALDDFLVKWEEAEDVSARRILLRDTAAYLGAPPKSLREDKRALQRWFSEEAMVDRFRTQIQTHLREIVILLEQRGKMVAFAVEKEPNLWQKIKFEKSLEYFWSYLPDPRLKLTAFVALARAIRGLSSEMRESSLSETTLRFIYRNALATRQDIWLQIAAMELLPELSNDTLLKALRIRLGRHHEGDDLFFRHRAIIALAPLAQSLEGAEELLLKSRTDPSEHVRMALASQLHHLTPPSRKNLLEDWSTTEPSHRVRSAMILNLCALDLGQEGFKLASEFLSLRLQTEEHPFARRVLMKVCGDLAEHFGSSGYGEEWFRNLGPQIHNWILKRKEAEQKRWGTRALSRCWIYSDPWRSSFLNESQAALGKTGLGRKAKLHFPAEKQEEALVVLSLATQEDHPLQVRLRRKSIKLFRGQKFGFRLWRTLHELFRSSPDKRQGHSHTIGRHYREAYQLPSFLMGEMSETKIPGEPLMIPEEGSWRPHLPLPDLALDALNGPWLRRKTHIVTPEGLTTLHVPLNPIRRLWCSLRLSLKIPSIAPLRNWNSNMNSPANLYAQRLKSCGVELSFTPADYGFGPLEDPTIQAVIASSHPPEEEREEP